MSSKKYGFTLIEMLVVTSIVSLFISITLAFVQDAKVNARNVVRIQNTNQVALAIELYKLDHNGLPPGDDFGEYINGVSDWIPGLVPDYLESLPVDPIDDGAYKFHYTRDGDGYVVVSLLENGGNSQSCNDGGNAGCSFYEKGTMSTNVYLSDDSVWTLIDPDTKNNKDKDKKDKDKKDKN